MSIKENAETVAVIGAAAGGAVLVAGTIYGGVLTVRWVKGKLAFWKTKRENEEDWTTTNEERSDLGEKYLESAIVKVADGSIFGAKGYVNKATQVPVIIKPDSAPVVPPDQSIPTAPWMDGGVQRIFQVFGPYKMPTLTSTNDFSGMNNPTAANKGKGTLKQEALLKLGWMAGRQPYPGDATKGLVVAIGRYPTGPAPVSRKFFFLRPPWDEVKKANLPPYFEFSRHEFRPVDEVRAKGYTVEQVFGGTQLFYVSKDGVDVKDIDEYGNNIVDGVAPVTASSSYHAPRGAKSL